MKNNDLQVLDCIPTPLSFLKKYIKFRNVVMNTYSPFCTIITLLLLQQNIYLLQQNIYTFIISIIFKLYYRDKNGEHWWKVSNQYFQRQVFDTFFVSCMESFLFSSISVESPLLKLVINVYWSKPFPSLLMWNFPLTADNLKHG